MHARVLIAICVLLVTATALAMTQAPLTTTNTPPPTSTIPPAYTYYPATGSFYKYHHERYVTWYVANNTCAYEGAHMVVLNDAKEADIIARIVRDAGGEHTVTWIGLRDHRTGGAMDWRTVHGEAISNVYNVWADGRPMNDTGFTCAYFSAYYKQLGDWFCSAKYYFICEISQQ